MQAFEALMEVARRLNDPETGCPWDVKQTFASLQKYILEEACELIDAVEDDKDKDLIEELGDLFYVVVFYCKVAERNKRFSMEEVLKQLREKLIRRHPHVFGANRCDSMQDVERQWDEIKSQEKKERTSALDGIPRSLGILARAQKVLSKLLHHDNESLKEVLKQIPQEGSLGEEVLHLILKAEQEELDIERLLRQALCKYEEAFKRIEKTVNL